MAERNESLLIVDDDLEFCETINSYLSRNYECHVAHNGKQALTQVEEHHPSLILLDLGLPDVSGLSLCEELVKSANENDSAVLVISGDTSLETKLEVFSMGAVDYVEKPVQLKDLESRVKRDLSFLEVKRSLQSSNEEANKLVEVTMSQASQYSYVMNFFKAMNTCFSIDQVVDKFFEAMGFFALKASLYTRLPESNFYDYTGQEVSPVEKNVFDTLLDKGRLYEFGNRLMVNDAHVSMLIKNLPEDEDIKGQVRDYAAALIEGMETKLRDLMLRRGVEQAISSLKNTVQTISSGIEHNNRIVSSALSDMLTEISSSYHELELTEHQEEFFTKLVERGIQKVSGAEGVLCETQNALNDLIMQMEKVQIAEAPEDDNYNDINDIELF